MRALLIQLNDSGSFNLSTFQEGKSLLSLGSLPTNATEIVARLGLPSLVLEPNLTDVGFAPLAALISSFSPASDPTIVLWKGDQVLASQLSGSASSVSSSSTGKSGVDIPEFSDQLGLVLLVTLFVVASYIIVRRVRHTPYE
jgi:hypothetical protein